MTTRSVGARAALVLLLSLGLGSVAVPSLALSSVPLVSTVPIVDAVAPTVDPPGADELPVVVQVIQVAPTVLTPGQDLSLTVTVTNTSAVPLAEPRLLVHLDRRAFISRSSLDRWREAGLDEAVGSVVLEVDLAAPLPPGASATVPAVVPATSLGLRNQATTWGARGLAVQVVDRADPARLRLGLARTFALWFPAQEVTATQVTVLVPLVGPAVDASGAWVDDLETLTRPGGRLAELLTATAPRHDVTWVLDPLLVEAASAAPDGTTDTSGTPSPAPTPTVEPSADTAGDGSADQTGSQDGSGGDTTEPGVTATAVPAAGPAARAWASTLLGAMTNREVRLLPYGDTDISALAHAGASDVLTTAVDRARRVARDGGVPETASTTLMWPAVALPDLTTAAFVRGSGDRALLVGPGELPAPDVLTYTPTGRTTISTRDGDLTVLVPDGRLSTGLATGLVARTPVADHDAAGGDDTEPDEPEPWQTTAARQVTGATAGQDLLAELAVITRERPSEARHLLMTVPRDWAPVASVVAGQLDALAAAPWVSVEPVSALIGAPDPEVERGTLPAAGSVVPTEVPPAEIQALRSATEDRAALAQIVEDPRSLLEDLEAEVLVPLSVAWRQDPAGRTSLVQASLARTQDLRSAVAVEPGSTVNLLSTTGALPVRVTNALDQDVRVTVSLRTGNPRLVADEAVEVTIPARDEEVVEIPVHAIQSADVAVVVEIRTPDGALVDDDTTLTVRVRAEWEGIGTAVVAALLALGVVIGLIRTIRRGRTSSRAAPVVAGPDALSPEVVDEEWHRAEEKHLGDLQVEAEHDDAELDSTEPDSTEPDNAEPHSTGPHTDGKPSREVRS